MPSPGCAAPLPSTVVPFDPRQSVADALKASNAARAARLAEARKKVDTRSFSTTWAAAWAQA
ncbi:hypothetical protein, partial [Methylobacterium sp. Leaf86]|uniref:hypothetical protein n=1 Tax=Methylobacterium sp. Leaf86 TaxID=1736242 RepID=UPI001AEBD1C6